MNTQKALLTHRKPERDGQRFRSIGNDLLSKLGAAGMGPRRWSF